MSGMTVQGNLVPVVSGIQDIYYNVQNIEKAAEFYVNVLGFKLVDMNTHWASLEIDGVRVGLHWTEGDPVPHVSRDAHGAHAGATLTLRVTSIDEALKRLKYYGVKLLGDISINPWGSLVSFEDPDGNVLKFMQPA